MLICPKCRNALDTAPIKCSNCGFLPANLNGYTAFNPEKASGYEGFPANSFSQLIHVEDSSFWFKARNKLIAWALLKYFSTFESLLEIGCGTGFVISNIDKSFPNRKLVGSEIYIQALDFASMRSSRVEFIQADARFLPFKSEFDVVAAFDVLERIKEDQLVLKNLYEATNLGGGCIITVPQHRWLWSPVDEEAQHERRYTSGEIHHKIEMAGFQIVHSTSFISFLLPFMYISRMKSRINNKSNSYKVLKIGGSINFIFNLVLSIEYLFIKFGIHFPVGGSRLVIAKKISNHDDK